MPSTVICETDKLLFDTVRKRLVRTWNFDWQENRKGKDYIMVYTMTTHWISYWALIVNLREPTDLERAMYE